MSDDWKPGDLAVCVDASGSRELCENTVYTVTWVNPIPALSDLGGIGSIGLLVAETMPGKGFDDFDARRFRRIRPDDQAGSREDWVLLIETHKQRVSA